ncbi:hypothetical protein [Micromonospora sp. NPDC004551]|uniref:hypothetical protein n=1 Tax=Micromonospora sp. NPDC004551 TaxID=3154284 RepID=UPI0033A8AECD
MTCDVCGLPDPYNGDGDGIGSCDCPRCDHGCGVARGSYLCCGDDDPGDDSDAGWDHDGEPWPDDVIVRSVETIHLPGVS